MADIEAQITTLMSGRKEDAVFFVKEMKSEYIAALERFTGDSDLLWFPVSSLPSSLLVHILNHYFASQGFIPTWNHPEGITLKDAKQDIEPGLRLLHFRQTLNKRQAELQRICRDEIEKKKVHETADVLAETIANFNRLVDDGHFLAHPNFIANLVIPHSLLTCASQMETLKRHVSSKGFSMGPNAIHRTSRPFESNEWAMELQPTCAQKMLSTFIAMVMADATT